MKLQKILTSKFIPNSKLTCEKDTYKLLQEQVFEKSFKLYTPILRGFPDYIVIKVYNKYEKHITSGFYEIKFKNNKLTKYQINFLSALAFSFHVYVVEVKQDYCFDILQVVV
ncbi:MAG: hypothetical protein ACPL1F_02925 [bacterium]